MLRIGAVSLLILGTLSACGHTPQERAASGALIGATAGAIVGLASRPDYDHDDGYDSRRYDDRRHDRRYEHRRHRRHHDHGGWRRHRDDDRWDYYD